MQNMERYFGFKVFVNSELDPADEEILRIKAKEILNIERFSLERYHIYFHQLVIKAKDEHFGFNGGLSKRVNKINIEFHVNQKQRLRKDIEFRNHIIDMGSPKDVKPYFTPDWIGYEVPISYFEGSNWFQNAIVAFVSKVIRKDHKKIKVIVTTTPTSEFLMALRSRSLSDVATQLDLKFERHVQLRLPFDNKRYSSNGGFSEMAGEKANTHIYINEGTAIAFGENAHAYDFVFGREVISDLRSLLTAAKEESKTSEASELEAAIEAAEEKKKIKVLEHLKNVGAWTIEKAEKLGMAAASEAIKVAINS